jgi:hypothetical protein
MYTYPWVYIPATLILYQGCVAVGEYTLHSLCIVPVGLSNVSLHVTSAMAFGMAVGNWAQIFGGDKSVSFLPVARELGHGGKLILLTSYNRTRHMAVIDNFQIVCLTFSLTSSPKYMQRDCHDVQRVRKGKLKFSSRGPYVLTTFFFSTS